MFSRPATRTAAAEALPPPATIARGHRQETLDLEDCLDLLAGPSLAVLLPGPI